jgi:hypothetical protein
MTFPEFRWLSIITQTDFFSIVYLRSSMAFGVRIFCPSSNLVSSTFEPRWLLCICDSFTYLAQCLPVLLFPVWTLYDGNKNLNFVALHRRIIEIATKSNIFASEVTLKKEQHPAQKSLCYCFYCHLTIRRDKLFWSYNKCQHGTYIKQKHESGCYSFRVKCRIVFCSYSAGCILSSHTRAMLKLISVCYWPTSSSDICWAECFSGS